MKKALLFSLILISSSVFAQDAPKGVDFFNGTFKQALAKAKKENKLVMFDAYTTWCGPCKVLKTKVFPNKELGEYINKHFVSIGVDMEAGEGIQLSNMYPVDGYPTILFLDGEGKVKKKILGLPRGGAQELLAIAKAIN
jgi:thioredoxin-related protein